MTADYRLQTCKGMHFCFKVSGIPDLPEARGKLCAAYDPAGAVIVCGGGERFWRPNANCWQLVAGDTAAWRDIPQVTSIRVV